MLNAVTASPSRIELKIASSKLVLSLAPPGALKLKSRLNIALNNTGVRNGSVEAFLHTSSASTTSLASVPSLQEVFTDVKVERSPEKFSPHESSLPPLLMLQMPMQFE